jgi:ribosomal protein L37AE/L43A
VEGDDVCAEELVEESGQIWICGRHCVWDAAGGSDSVLVS